MLIDIYKKLSSNKNPSQEQLLDLLNTNINAAEMVLYEAELKTGGAKIHAINGDKYKLRNVIEAIKKDGLECKDEDFYDMGNLMHNLAANLWFNEKMKT